MLAMIVWVIEPQAGGFVERKVFFGSRMFDKLRLRSRIRIEIIIKEKTKWCGPNIVH
jgi:hypothetical protein